MAKNFYNHLAGYTEGAERTKESRKILNHLTVREFTEEFGRDDFDSLMLDVAHLRLQKGARSVQSLWPDLVTRTSISDFKANYVASVGSFPDLAEVKEFGEYPEVTFADQDTSYSATKYGSMFSVSMEARANDALGELGRNTQKFGAASARTIEKFVLETNMNDNPTYSVDSVAVWNETSHANSLNAGDGYTRAGLVEALALFGNQTDRDGNQINIQPRRLIVSPDDYIEALEDVASATKMTVDEAGSAATFVGTDSVIKNFGLEVRFSPYITAGTFFLFADPNEYEGIEVGFMNGRSDPEIMVEQPNTGFSFEHDAERVKCRLIFGGTWIDYRASVRGGIADS